MEGGRREVGGEMRRGGERWEEEQKLEKDREVVFQTTYEYGLCSKLVESRDLEIVRFFFQVWFCFLLAPLPSTSSFRSHRMPPSAEPTATSGAEEEELSAARESAEAATRAVEAEADGDDDADEEEDDQSKCAACCEDCLEKYHAVCENVKFTMDDSFTSNFILSIIVLAGVLVGVQTYELDPEVTLACEITDKTITFIFLVEAVLKIFGEGPHHYRYFLDPWNVFDFFIVVRACCVLRADPSLSFPSLPPVISFIMARPLALRVQPPIYTYTHNARSFLPSPLTSRLHCTTTSDHVVHFLRRWSGCDGSTPPSTHAPGEALQSNPENDGADAYFYII